MLYKIGTRAGKITFTAILTSIVMMAFVFFFDVQHGGKIQTVAADTATTSVTVVNIPPVWTVPAMEIPASTTTAPTNVGSAVTWEAIGTDANAEDYYLLICKTTGAVPNAAAAPNCDGGGADQWAVSGVTVSGATSTASYTALAGDGETEVWYAYICDSNIGTPGCNAIAEQGTGDHGSPFNVNHAPTFTVYDDGADVLPGNVATWTTTASDGDSVGGADQVQLHVCTTAAFTASGGCTVGTWATSTFAVSDPSATTSISIPYPDGDAEAYGYIVDQHGLVASGGSQGSDSVLTIANATPTIASSTVSIVGSNGSPPIILSVEQGETPAAAVINFAINDDNSCIQDDLVGDEFSSVKVNLFHSPLVSGTCDEAGEYNANNCYTYDSLNWAPTCAQDAGSCLGASDPEATWTCTTSMWYIADATDGGSQFPNPGEDWLATVQASDDDFATSTLVLGENDVPLQQFLAFDLGTTSIAYGALQPGENNNPAPPRATDLLATGNVGIDETIEGIDMCPETSFPACSGNATSTIFVWNQKYSLASTTWALGATLTSTTTPELELNVVKTIATSSPASALTYWGINVPLAISQSGDYIGQNTIFGVVSEVGEW